MLDGLIGRKLGMTQVFEEDGRVTPVTVIQAGPCVVVQKKDDEKDGYSAVQLGLVEARKATRTSRPMEGHFKKADVAPTRILKEFDFSEAEDDPVNVGDNILVHKVFRINEYVDVSGRTIGRGFQGVMKRHGFHGGRATHGSMFHRAPGSIGCSASPSRVYPGTKLPGQTGDKPVKIRRLRVVRIDEDRNLIMVKGAVPGSKGNYVIVTRSK